MRLSLPTAGSRIKTTTIIDLCFILYICNPMLTNMIFHKILSFVGLQAYARVVTLGCIYLPLLFVVLTTKLIPLDFLALFSAVLAFFAVTLLLHPEYEYWYARENYGVWVYVLRPDNGLYMYLFLRMVNDPKRVMKCIRISCYPMYFYYGYLLLRALSRGYWEQQDFAGRTILVSYNLTFGYEMLFFALVFLYAAFKERKLFDIGMAGLGILFILLGGSRGPILDIAIFVVLYVIFMAEGKKKARNATLLVIGFGLILMLWPLILQGLAFVVAEFGIQSRTLNMLISSGFADGNGRNEIWAAAVEMIRDNPFGYGAMGTRHVIQKLHIVGHPHQFFLEVLVDYGVIAGGILILFLLSKSFQIFASDKNLEWKGIFLIYFGRACHLLVSGTYWTLEAFWGCLAIGMAIYVSNKREQRSLKWHHHASTMS